MRPDLPMAFFCFLDSEGTSKEKIWDCRGGKTKIAGRAKEHSNEVKIKPVLNKGTCNWTSALQSMGITLEVNKIWC